ncbi:MAG: hypothetical protein MUF50_00380 [Planctomycetes bacterium]|jgi:hypothetical protein|nr:hypothetical protein [Planctomycetota bacterium]
MKNEIILLDPRPTTFDKTKLELQEKNVLGFEVTIPELAEACNCGNIDPQHTNKNYTLAAIEEALTFPLNNEINTYATIRSDSDSIGAMVVYQLRLEGYLLEKMTDVMERIKLIASADKHNHGPWPGPRSLPKLGQPYGNGHKHDRPLTGIAGMMNDYKKSLKEKTEAMRNWLLNNIEPEGYRQKAETIKNRIAQAINNREVNIIKWNDLITIVETHQTALGREIGYYFSPIVTVFNPKTMLSSTNEYIKKHSVSQFSPGYVDLEKTYQKATRLDLCSWGGGLLIGGSHQGESSILSPLKVAEILKQNCLT